jgi:3-oxoadipate enol-lactonase
MSDISFVDGPRHKIAYRRSGSGHPLVLLHPLALSFDVWGEFAVRLSETFDVIAPDARGHGSSGWDGEQFSVDGLADDVRMVLDSLGIEAAHVIGLSMGGSTAVSFAGRYPERASAMFLADTTAWYGAEAPRTWEERAQGVLAQPRQRQVTFQVDRWFTEAFRNRNPVEVNRVVRIFLQTSSLAHAAACRALGTMDSRAVLKQVTAPTMVVTGEEDCATPPAMGQAIADGVPAGQARVLPALRHMSLVEDPALADTAAEFLSAARVGA